MDLKEISFPINIYFPEEPTADLDGLVAVGGNLFPLILIEAYSKGIFPWTGRHPIPWYSPEPRLLLRPREFRLARRLAREISKQEYTVRFDGDFHGVMEKCAQVKRPGQQGTWITANMVEAYGELFELKIAHCVEVFAAGELCGGLYGLSLGRAFFGESMFHTRTNYSKIALYCLVKKLLEKGIEFIDCQQATVHMKSLGALEFSRVEFLTMLRLALKPGILSGSWA